MPIFPVDAVEPVKNELPTEDTRTSIQRLLKVDNIEATNEKPVIKQQGYHSLIYAVHTAYDEHRPLILSPDMIWTTISQGVAIHINENAEKLRKLFVEHEGKADIIIRRDNFVKGSPHNDWMGCWDEFATRIKEHVGDKTHDLFVNDFSTTTIVEKAVSQVVLMDAMQSYFSYGMVTACGIPYIKLTGTQEDWQKILTKIDSLDKFELDFWTPQLRTILSNFIKAYDEPDTDYWKTIFKVGGGSGGPFITGWIINLFPYLTNRGKYTKNHMLDREISTNPRHFFGGITHDRLPGSASRVPFTWYYYGTELDYEFLAGILAVEQEYIPEIDTFALKPSLTYAVREKEKPKEKPKEMPKKGRKQ